MTADDGKRLRYMEIADDLRSRIREGRIADDRRVGTFGSLGEEYGVAKGTIEKALGILRQEGAVYTMSGKGIFAAEDAGRPPSASPADGAAELRAELARIEANLIELYDKTGNPYPWEGAPEAPGKNGQREHSA